jgi:RNA recognition motif-containing protein
VFDSPQARSLIARENGHFGFVKMPNKEEAGKAISGLNGKDLKGHPLTVNETRPRTSGGGRGGFGDPVGERGVSAGPSDVLTLGNYKNSFSFHSFILDRRRRRVKRLCGVRYISDT